MSPSQPFVAAVGLCLLALLATASTSASAASPGLDAIDEFRVGGARPSAIENRFFLKADRFEVSPIAGYVPNNPFAKRYVGGVLLAYHFRESLAAEGVVTYSPDLGSNDLKGLTKTLVQIAQTGTGTTEFQQPLDKVTLAAAFSARWTPLYGKINLVGETVLNFDFYGTAGVGMVSKENYYAVNNPNATSSADVALLEPQGNEVKVGPVLGFGGDFFISQTIALKIDTRMSLFVDNVPDYQPDRPDETDDDQRLYNNFVASAGLSFFFPKMKPRLYNF